MQKTCEIEIGLKVDARIYLHIIGNDMETPFSRRDIVNLSETENGTMVTIIVKGPEPWSSGISEEKYEVTEKISDIKNAITTAKKYETIAITAVSDNLEK